MTIKRTGTPQTLRDYQLEAVNAIELAWLKYEKPICFMATGAGKTSVMAELISRNFNPQSERLLAFVHRQEIVQQIAERIANQCAGLQDYYFRADCIAPGIGIEMASEHAPNARIVVAGVQSLHARRLGKLLEHGVFDYAIIDESHHYAAGNSYHKVLDGLFQANAAMKLVGFTATPKRHDRKALGSIFTNICYERSILDGIKGGYLVPVQRVQVKTLIDASGINTNHGDYDQTKLVSVLETNNWVELAVQAYKDYIQPEDRLAMAFFPAVEMSQEFTAAARAAGIAAAHLDGETDKETRAAILRDYRSGQLRLVSNVGVLTEGVDVPETAAILMARPTRSEGLFTQIIGRGLRLADAKTDCLIVDLTVSDTKALDMGTLLGKMSKCESCAREYYKGLPACPHCGWSPAPHIAEERGERREKVLYDAVGGAFQEEIISIFASLAAAWYRGPDEWLSVSLGYKAGAFVIAPPSYATNHNRLMERLVDGKHLLRQWNEPNIFNSKRNALLSQIARLERELARIDKWSLYYVREDRSVAPMQASDNLPRLLSDADIEALGRCEERRQIKRDADWRYGMVTPGQLQMLHRFGVTADEGMSKGDASAQIQHAISVPLVRRWIEIDRLPDRMLPTKPELILEKVANWK